MHFEKTKRTVIITGAGFREQEGKGQPSNVFTGVSVKPNIGAAVALEAAQEGYTVVLVARTASKLQRIKDSLCELVKEANVEVAPCDLLDPENLKHMLAILPDNQEIDLVHSAGLSAASYSVPDDNPYLPLAETPADLPLLEYESVVKTLLVTSQALLPRMRDQTQANIVVISSMSGIRAVPLGFSHSSAKGGLHQAVRSMALELNPLGIRVSEVLPGIVDTGLYDTGAVDAAARKIGEAFGYSYRPRELPQMEPSAVAEAVLLCLKSRAHILSIAMVAQGQFPHVGA